jgi:hypothetical protein
MEKHQLYCQPGFLNDLFGSLNEKIDLQNFADEVIFRASLQNFFLRNAILNLDISKEELNKIEDTSRLRFILKAYVSGEIGINFLKDQNKSIGPDDEFFYPRVHEIFFLDEPEAECKKLENSYGLIFISKENMSKAKFLFDYSLVPLRKNRFEPKPWKFLNKFKHPFNSMVIADNYLFPNPKIRDNVKNQGPDFIIDTELNSSIDNVVELLKNIMPVELNKTTFHLSLVIVDKLKEDEERNRNSNKKANNYRIDIHAIQKYLSERLKKVFDYPVELTVLRTVSSIQHDRNILTNYIWINSGYGFNIYRQDGKIRQNTHLSFFPLTHLQGVFHGYDTQNKNPDQSAYNSVSKVYASLQKHFSFINNNEKTEFAGSKMNRLLSHNI